ncbi:MAG TPA: response regulator [Luteimonas sp.]|nr:response regulator [Luteimonas sp.]
MNTPRILLVEDDPTTRAFMTAALESFPARVDQATTVATARTTAAAHPHALWLFDAHLPDGDGAGLLALLRRDGYTVPAIAHTAAREPALHRALIQAGFQAVLTKPLGSAELHAAVAAVLGAPAPSPCRPRVAETAARDLGQPVWDDEAALSALHGQQAHVDALRGLFLDELAGSRDAVRGAFDRGDAGGIEAALHRLRASCGFVGACRLGSATIDLQRRSADPDALARFLDATQATLSSAGRPGSGPGDGD